MGERERGCTCAKVLYPCAYMCYCMQSHIHLCPAEGGEYPQNILKWSFGTFLSAPLSSFTRKGIMPASPQPSKFWERESLMFFGGLANISIQPLGKQLTWSCFCFLLEREVSGSDLTASAFFCFHLSWDWRERVSGMFFSVPDSCWIKSLKCRNLKK